MRLMFVEVDKADSAVNWKSYVHEWIQFAFSVAKLIWRVHSKLDANAIMCDLHIWCLYWNKCRMNFHVNWSTTSDYIDEFSITNMFNPIDFFIIGYIIEALAKFSQAFSRNLYNYQAAISISSISQVNVFLFSFIISPLSSATRTTKLEAFMFSLTLISRTWIVSLRR